MVTAFCVRSCSSGRWALSTGSSSACAVVAAPRSSSVTAFASTRPTLRKQSCGQGTRRAQTPSMPQQMLPLHEGAPKRSVSSPAAYAKGSRSRHSRRQCMALIPRSMHITCTSDIAFACSRPSSGPVSRSRAFSPSLRFHSTSSSAASVLTAPRATIISSTPDERRIRGMSSRISLLPQWSCSSVRTQITPIDAVSIPQTRPLHHCLVHLYEQTQEQSDKVPSASPVLESTITSALDICALHHKDLQTADFSFILEVIQAYSTSQQQFWESVASLVRYSVPNQRRGGAAVLNEWQRTIGYAITEVSWSQDESLFLQQVAKAMGRVPQVAGAELQSQRSHISTHAHHREEKFTDGEILAHAMIEGLLGIYQYRRAMDLYELLLEQGVVISRQLLRSFIRIAVHKGDGAQLERIGKLVLRQEDAYKSSVVPPTTDDRAKDQRLLMSARIMDSFVYGACEHQLYDLARAVFDRGLAAGQHYKISTFTAILNTYSVKEFGFDVVAAAMALGADSRSHKDHITRASRQGGNRTNKVKAKIDLGDKRISVADPEDIEKYVRAMEDQGVKPDMTTLNVLVKLHLEMYQYRVHGTPHWRMVFQRYNPLQLQPDTVTNNTLLAYHEKRKDLAAMRKIYDSMAGVPETMAATTSRQTRKLHRMQRAEQFDSDNDHDEQETSDKYLSDRHRPSAKARHVRSNRDIYTYNTMLHALLQHAVESKDIAAIGQCFHDMEQDGITADTATFNTNILYHISRNDLISAVQVFRSMKGADSSASGEANPIQLPKPSSGDPLSSDYWDAESLRSFDALDSRLPPPSSKPVKSRPTLASALRRRNGSVQTLVQDTTLSTGSQSPQVPSPAMAFDAPSAPAPDIVTLTALISGFARADNMDKATHFFKEMTERYHLEPNLKTYSTLVAGLHRAGEHERAEKLWGIVLDEEKECPPGFATEVSVRGVPDDRECKVSETDLNAAKAEHLSNETLQEQQRRVRLPTLQPAARHLTIIERLQAETRRRLFRESLKG
ncbi:unnamed protein product [Mortierella alpina]